MIFRTLLISLCLMVAASDIPTTTLYNGVVVPLVGLGCASGVREEHVSSALSIGYRYLDTAQSYNWGYHEDEVGDALQKFHSQNDDPVFVQTKIHPEDLGYEATKRAIQDSLNRLKTKTLDSVLIHKPHCWEGACRKVPEGTWQESWKLLEEYYEAGIITKSIGICDVSTPEMLNELLDQRIKPHVIQNWMDPLHQDKAMRELIQEQGILYQAYSSLGTQWRSHPKNPVTTHPILLDIAKAHGADVGQVVVNWATLHGVMVLPASTNPDRQWGNLHDSFRFVLTEEEMHLINALDGRAPKDDKKETGEVMIMFEQDRASDAEMTDVYWVGHDETEVHVGFVKPGQALSLRSFHGHTFRFRDSSGDTKLYREHRIDQEGGEEQIHVIVLADEDEL